MSRPFCPRDLFTRVQIAQLTGIDDSTLNYWMREGILRATEGGTGRGSHRRFEYREVTLAGVLQELKMFGIGTPDLASISQVFHDALDWMSDHEISYENYYSFLDLCRIQRDINHHGSFQAHLLGKPDEEPFSHLEKHYQGRSTWVELTWEQAVAYEFRVRPGYPKRQRPSDEHIALVRTWQSAEDFRPFYRMELLWSALDDIRFIEPKDREGDGTYFFRRYANGKWDVSETRRPSESIEAVSFIGVDIAMLSFKIWRDWAERSGSALAARNQAAGYAR